MQCMQIWDAVTLSFMNYYIKWKSLCFIAIRAITLAQSAVRTVITGVFEDRHGDHDGGWGRVEGAGSAGLLHGRYGGAVL